MFTPNASQLSVSPVSVSPISGPRRSRRARLGAALVEYVLLVALIAAVCVGAVTLLGTSANAKLNNAATSLK